MLGTGDEGQDAGATEVTGDCGGLATGASEAADGLAGADAEGWGGLGRPAVRGALWTADGDTIDSPESVGPTGVDSPESIDPTDVGSRGES